MHESEADLVELQELLDRSHASAGPHLSSIFDSGHRPTAAELAATLEGIFEMHLAVVAGDGSPLVAPIDAIFFKGKVWFSLPSQSVRARLVPRDHRVSASYTRGSFAFILHGTARDLTPADPLFREFDDLVTELYVGQFGPGWIKWREHLQAQHGPGYTAWIEPRALFAKR